jgi:hypothetical protein
MDLSTIQSVLARLRAAAGPQSLVDLYGSTVYAPADAADVDVREVLVAERLGPARHRELMRADPQTVKLSGQSACTGWVVAPRSSGEIEVTLRDDL